MRKTANPRPSLLWALQWLPGKSRVDQCSSKRRDTSNTELCTMRRKLPLVLHSGVNFMDESSSFRRQAPMLARQVTDLEKYCGSVGLVSLFRSTLPFSILCAPSLFPQKAVPMFASEHFLATIDVQICSRCTCANSPWLADTSRHREGGLHHETGEVPVCAMRSSKTFSVS